MGKKYLQKVSFILKYEILLTSYMKSLWHKYLINFYEDYLHVLFLDLGIELPKILFQHLAILYILLIKFYQP